LLQCFNFIVFSLLISTNVFIILLKSIYFETADGGINSARIRLCVGEEGPSRLKYALETAKMAKEARMNIFIWFFFFQINTYQEFIEFH